MIAHRGRALRVRERIGVWTMHKVSSHARADGLGIRRVKSSEPDTIVQARRRVLGSGAVPVATDLGPGVVRCPAPLRRSVTEHAVEIAPPTIAFARTHERAGELVRSRNRRCPRGRAPPTPNVQGRGMSHPVVLAVTELA